MLEIHHLEKLIDGRCVLAIETLAIEAGDVVAALGPSGAGKSLLIALLAGVLPPSGGTILLDGNPLVSGPTRMREQMSVLFAEDLLYERLSVWRNLVLACQWQGLPTRRISEVLAQIGLSDQAQTAAKQLTPSGQRRLAFARILLGQRQLLLLDQPTLRADLETQQLMARLIRQAAEADSMILVTDADLTWASTCCTRVLELQEGQVAKSYAFTRSSLGTENTTVERLTPFKVPANKEDRILLYDPGAILYATSRDSKTYLRTAEEEILTHCTLQELETRLTGRGFFKAHRAYPVNLQHLKAVVQYTRGSYLLLLDDQEETLIPPQQAIGEVPPGIAGLLNGPAAWQFTRDCRCSFLGPFAAGNGLYTSPHVCYTRVDVGLVCLKPEHTCAWRMRRC
ncbi:MAG TPA: ATP-binding cassette domain-containing protein [Ktedonobacterales bacterium]|nr:ATP-binding cassette domain-containing protein [Ktedonobacterales bacterium]